MSRPNALFLNAVSTKQMRRVKTPDGQNITSYAVMIPVPKTIEEQSQTEAERDNLAKKIGFYPKNGAILENNGSIFVKCNCGYCDRQSIQLFEKDTRFAETCAGCGAPYELEFLPDYVPPKEDKPLAKEYGDVWASILVKESQIYPSRRPDGRSIDGFVDVLLGNEDIVRQVQIRTTNKETNERTFDKVSMTNQEIYDQFKEVRDHYVALSREKSRGHEFDDVASVENTTESQVSL